MQNKVYTKMRYSNPCGIVKARGPDMSNGSKQERRRKANALLLAIKRINNN